MLSFHRTVLAFSHVGIFEVYVLCATFRNVYVIDPHLT